MVSAEHVCPLYVCLTGYARAPYLPFWKIKLPLVSQNAWHVSGIITFSGPFRRRLIQLGEIKKGWGRECAGDHTMPKGAVTLKSLHLLGVMRANVLISGSLHDEFHLCFYSFILSGSDTSECMVFQKELYRFEGLYQFIQRTCRVFRFIIIQQNTQSFTWDSYDSMWLQLVIQDVPKSVLKLWKLIWIYSEDMYSVFNCHNVRNTPSFTWDSYGSMWFLLVMQDVTKRALQLWKLIWINSEDMYSVLYCHNVAKHTELYLG
jgi:hypothetical protein